MLMLVLNVDVYCTYDVGVSCLYVELVRLAPGQSLHL